jgi:hypothetical protein
MTLAFGAAGNVATERANTRQEYAKVAAGVWQACGKERSSARTPAAHANTERLKLPKIRVARRAKQRYLQARVELLAVPTPEVRSEAELT